MRRLSTVLLTIGILLTADDPATAGNSGKKNQSGSDVGAAVAAVITAAEIATINGYLHQHSGNLPPEFADAKPLPPGIARKIARGGTMPPGIAKRYFPTTLLQRLPPRPGQEWLVVGTDILLIQAATGIILDILNDIL